MKLISRLSKLISTPISTRICKLLSKLMSELISTLISTFISKLIILLVSKLMSRLNLSMSGIDFADRHGRAVIVTGIPFPAGTQFTCFTSTTVQMLTQETTSLRSARDAQARFYGRNCSAGMR